MLKGSKYGIFLIIKGVEIERIRSEWCLSDYQETEHSDAYNLARMLIITLNSEVMSHLRKMTSPGKEHATCLIG